MDVGRHNVIVGQNNTGKSNLLWAIHCFYYPKDLTFDDITKKKIKDDKIKNIEKEEQLSKELKIILTFNDLSEEEKRNNKKYFHNGIVKITLRAWVDKDSKFKYEHHGFVHKQILKFPFEFDNNLKFILESPNVPKKSELEKFKGLNDLLQNIQPKGKIKDTNWEKIKEKFLSNHPEIESELKEVKSPEKYQGFAKTRMPDTTGECFLIPAQRDPSEILQTTKANSPVNQLVQLMLQGIETEGSMEGFKRIQNKIIKEREKKKIELEKKFKEELKVWNTTVDIKLKKFELKEAFPVSCDLFFNDGVITNLERKGTGLQRYVFFKFLKIKNELSLTSSISFILLFEEPEAHLHPQIQREIASILKELTENEDMSYQTFITTHSPQFIDMENLDEVFIFNKEEEGCTKSNKCLLNLTGMKEKIKTILFFDPHVSEIFFAEKIVLIEGQSEEIISNLLIQEGKLQVSNISIVNAKSKNNIPTFLNVFNSLRIPYCVLADEDPYFLPYLTNPNRVKGKRKAYKKTIEIANLIDESIGKLVIISPDFDNFMGITKSQIDNKGKPLAAYEKFLDLRTNNPKEIEKIEKLFNLLINSQELKHKIVNFDGLKWEYKDEKSVQIPKAEYKHLKNAINQKFNQYKDVITSLSNDQKGELFDLLKSEIKVSIDKKNSKKHKNIHKNRSNLIKRGSYSTGSIDKWLKKKSNQNFKARAQRAADKNKGYK